MLLYGAHDQQSGVPVISFNIDGLPAEEVAYALDSAYDIAVRSGLHCASQAHRITGTEKVGAVRVSFGHHTTVDDVSCFLEAVAEIVARV